MKIATALATAVVVAGCGSGTPSGQRALKLGIRSKAATSDAQRQAVLDACMPPFTGATGGKLTEAFCGIELPADGTDPDPQRWWDVAGCLTDHPEAFSDSCKSLFAQTCGTGDSCICSTGEVLAEDGSCKPATECGQDDGCPPVTCPAGQVVQDGACVPAGSCDNDLECPVPNGLGKCSNYDETDPPSGTCSIAACDSGFAMTPDRKSCVACDPAANTVVDGVCTPTGIYSEQFTQNMPATQAQCDRWNNFRSALKGTYTSVTINSSIDPIGVSCTGEVANQICHALRDRPDPSSSTTFLPPQVFSCGGRSWAVGGCGASVAIAGDETAVCNCDVHGYSVRPCIQNTAGEPTNPNWGGAGTPTCSGPSQRLNVICQ